MGVNKGDVLVIPAPNNKHKNDDNKMTIHWQQMFRQRDGDYYVLVAKNKSKHQYGSTNIWGQNQFIVWHDKDRKPYANLEGDVADTIQNTGGAIAQKIEVIGGSFIGIPLKTF
ncbi:hypothetical protein M407DRAFT_12482 [Tulasnella calospora MUT 4182]|uniref:Uncharacterized protein n=1 Tax=Tulasnella calospora MUT 4182 TaxID=1051891 RepID=A0A0C3Q2P7_9AGAM|nr:hypothetical protein M407DRAFT_12482 [Tulasnella calospora MUT 4182]